LPKEYRFSGDRVLIKKAGNAVVLLPEKGSWDPLFKNLPKFSDDFMESRKQPTQQTRNKLFE
jgi:antitoxin VapB